MKKLLTSVVMISILAVIMAGCGNNAGGSGGNEGGEGSNANQELTYATTSDVVGLSPIDTNDSVSAAMIEQIYGTLFKRDPETMEIKPHLAESYENPDDLTWEIKLKEGIEFHDGTPFNAEAVKYTFEEFMDEERAAPRASLLAPIDTVEVKDEHTVVIKTKEPYGPLLAALSHTNASIVSPTADKEGELNNNPVGTGPFVFEEWSKGDKVVLSRNENYWKDPAELEKVTMKVVPEYATAVSMLETGEVQFLDAIPPEQLPRIESLNNVEIQKKEGTQVYYLGFNMDKEPYNDKNFRKAVSHAVDREAYVNQLNGLGIKNNSIIGPQVFGYDEAASEEGYSYDPEKAKQIIEENGFEGQTISMLVANRESYMKMAEIVQSQLTEVGFDVSVETMEWGTFLDATTAGEFQMTFMGWSNSTADGSELLYPNLHSDNIGSSNRMSYDNSEFDKLVDQSRTTVDQEKRKEYLDKANVMAINDGVWVPMHHGVVTAAYDESVEGLTVDPTGQWSLYGVSRK